MPTLKLRDTLFKFLYELFNKFNRAERIGNPTIKKMYDAATYHLQNFHLHMQTRMTASDDR